jgi:hypothetical protein
MPWARTTGYFVLQVYELPAITEVGIINPKDRTRTTKKFFLISAPLLKKENLPPLNSFFAIIVNVNFYTFSHKHLSIEKK